MTIVTFRKGLLRDSDLFKELVKYSCSTMTDILNKIDAQIKWEVEMANHIRKS